MQVRNVLWAGLIAVRAAPAMATPLVVNQFNSAADAAKWRYDFGLPATLTFDPLKDAGGSASSGSLRVETTFAATAGGENKSAITTDAFSPGRDVSGYSTLDADLFIAPGSAESFNPGSDIHGYRQFAIRNTDNYNYQSEGGANFTPSGSWMHVSIPVSSFAQPVNAMRALTLQLYGGPGHNLTGPVTYWIDNVVFVPEPGSAALLIVPLAAASLRRRRRTA
jgi:hypothetical protein